MSDAGTDAAAAAPACAIDGLEAEHCRGYLCGIDGDAFLVLTKDSRFDGAALGWNASICEHSLGWPTGATTDSVTFMWPLTLRELRELGEGAQTLVYYAGPGDPPTAESLACTVEIASPLPVCPPELGDRRHGSLGGCRGPLDQGCAVCKEYPWGPTESSTWSSSSGGADFYNVASSLLPTSCTTECPACARCSYRDEELARALPARPECRPCPADLGVDPCFAPDSCDCWCASYAQLSEDCPTVLE